jgi:hypothetical protein
MRGKDVGKYGDRIDIPHEVYIKSADTMAVGAAECIAGGLALKRVASRSEKESPGQTSHMHTAIALESFTKMLN